MKKTVVALPVILLGTFATTIATSCRFAPLTTAQTAPCLSDSVDAKLLAAVRSALRAPSVPADIQLKADSAYVTTDGATCAVADSAYNSTVSVPVSSVYVVVVPGAFYVVMPATPDGELWTLTWFKPDWGDPVLMQP